MNVELREMLHKIPGCKDIDRAFKRLTDVGLVMCATVALVYPYFNTT